VLQVSTHWQSDGTYASMLVEDMSRNKCSFFLISNITCFMFHIHLWPIYWRFLVFETAGEYETAVTKWHQILSSSERHFTVTRQQVTRSTCISHITDPLHSVSCVCSFPEPVTVAARPRTRTVFTRSNTGILDLSPARVIDVCTFIPCLCCPVCM
jgi:hypothetical protein